jgi:exopolyphosphatase
LSSPKSTIDSSTDLDSLCSAIVLAYLRTYAPKSSDFYIPLSNLPRADLSLRPELLPVLSHAGLKLEDLITLSDLPPTSKRSAQLPPEKTSWVLVDHNALQGDLGRTYGRRIIGCIDHHDEEEKVPRDCEPRIIRKSGSCSSLIIEHYREAWNSLAKSSTSKETMAWDAELAKLALAPVLIDTTNLTAESKTTPTDTEAVRYLTANITAEQGSECRPEDYFKEISEAKEDIGGLSVYDILRKDYKQWTEKGSLNLGVSSVVKDIQFLIEKSGSVEKFFDVHKGFAAERELALFSIMTTSTPEGVFKRELLLWATNEKAVGAAKKFEENAKKQLGLVTGADGAHDFVDENQWRRYWWQERVEHSRKQVAPLLRDALAE